jgi:DNA-binding CsgD family transcriptional regulator
MKIIKIAGTPPHPKRKQMIELLNEGQTASEIAEATGTEEVQVRYLLAAWWTRRRSKIIKDESRDIGSFSQKFPHFVRVVRTTSWKQKEEMRKLLYEGQTASEIAEGMGLEEKKVSQYLKGWWKVKKKNAKVKNGEDIGNFSSNFPSFFGNSFRLTIRQINEMAEMASEGQTISEIAEKTRIDEPRVMDSLKYWWQKKKKEEKKEGTDIGNFSQKFPNFSKTVMLSEKQRKDIVKRIYKGESYSEIADELDIQEKKVYRFVANWWQIRKREAERLGVDIGHMSHHFPHLSNSSKKSMHKKGGESRSWHEVIIRDIFFFTGIDFIYEPWYNLEETQKVAPKIKDKTYDEIFESIRVAAIDYNLERDEDGNPIPVLDKNGKQAIDPETKKPAYKRKEIDGEEHNAYEKRKPSPDFLINGKLYFEVFGWAGQKYELKKELKKDQFNKLLEEFRYIEKEPLGIAAKQNRSLIAYASALDSNICLPCGQKVCPCNSSLGIKVLNKLLIVSPLLEANGKNIKLIDNYVNHMSQYVQYGENDENHENPQETEQLAQDRAYFNENIPEYWNWYNQHKNQKYEQWRQQFVSQNNREPTSEDLRFEQQNFVPNPQEINEFFSQKREANTSNWHKMSQVQNQKRPLTIPQIGQELVSQGLWTANSWSAEDKVAAYYKTPEALTQILRSLGVEVADEVQTPKQVRERGLVPAMAFNLHRFKKEARFFYDQTFSDDEGTWNVPDILDHAKQHGELTEIPVKDLLNNLEPSPQETGDELPGSPEFIERAKKADLKYPIIVIKYPDGLFIADGVHRLWKAKEQQIENMKAYLMDHSQLSDIKEST